MRKIIRYFQNNPLIFLMFVCIMFIIESRLADTTLKWLWIPCVRLVLHAVAAVVTVLCFNMINLYIMFTVREILGAWVALIGHLGIIKRKNTLRLRKFVMKITYLLHPISGTMLYIIKAYDWELYQANLFERTIQTDQLAVDIIFAVLAYILWIVYFKSFAQKPYALSVGDAILLIKAILEKIELMVIFENNDKLDDKVNYFIQKLFLIIAIITPIWLTAIIVWYCWFIIFLPAWWYSEV